MLLVVNVALSIWGILVVRFALPFPAAAGTLAVSLPWWQAQQQVLCLDAPCSGQKQASQSTSTGGSRCLHLALLC